MYDTAITYSTTALPKAAGKVLLASWGFVVGSAILLVFGLCLLLVVRAARDLVRSVQSSRRPTPSECGHPDAFQREVYSELHAIGGGSVKISGVHCDLCGLDRNSKEVRT